MNTLLTLIRKVRAITMRTLLSRSRYISSESVKPISTKYGYDRGTPVDRVFIERFLEKYEKDVKGECLEIVDPTYIQKYGKDKVTKSDVLDIIPRKTTTIHGDLRNLDGVISDNSYDTLIITQTLNVIDDYEAAIRESFRILKPGGLLLVTLPTISPAWNLKINMWRFSVKSLKHIFSKHFNPAKVTVEGLGNKTVAECFWLGMSVQDLTEKELNDNDPKFPVILGVAAYK